MNIKKTVLASLVCGAVALMSGCATQIQSAETPVPVNFEKQEQQKLQSASHWQTIADDVTGDLRKSLAKTTGVSNKLHVIQSNEDSMFQKAFNEQLISSLIESGYTVMKAPDMFTRNVQVKTTPVYFSEKQARNPQLGEATALAGGLWVLKNIYNNVSPGAAMMGAALSYDAYKALNSKYNTATPQTELVVTVSVSDASRYYANVTNVYYTPGSNLGHYAQQKQIKIKGDK